MCSFITRHGPCVSIPLGRKTHQLPNNLKRNKLCTHAVPAIGMGIFNQDIREKVLMQVPELYSIGREGKSFGVKRFIIYMVEGTYQGAIVYLVLAYTYNTNSTRRDGWDIPMDEFSTVVIVATILACNLFIGLGQLCWNWWAFGCVCFGPVAIIVYTLLYSAIRPELM